MQAAKKWAVRTKAGHRVFIAPFVILLLHHFHRFGLECVLAHYAINLKVEQHLAGKNHTRLAAGLPGLKPGYFNKATGKWERAPPEEHQETPTPAPTPSLPSTSLGSKVANEHNFYCQLCKVICCQF